MNPNLLLREQEHLQGNALSAPPSCGAPGEQPPTLSLMLLRDCGNWQQIISKSTQFLPVCERCEVPNLDSHLKKQAKSMLTTAPPEPGCLAYLSSRFILGKVLMATARGNPGGRNYAAFCPPHWALGHVKEMVDHAEATGPSVGFAWMLIFCSPASLQRAEGWGRGTPHDEERG